MTRLYIQKLQRVWKWDYKDLKILKSDEYKRQQLIKHQLFQKQLATESNRPSLSPGFARNKPKTNQPRIAGKATTGHKLLTSARCRLVPKGPRKLNRSKNIWILIGSGSISLFYVIPYMQKIHKMVKATSLSGIAKTCQKISPMNKYRNSLTTKRHSKTKPKEKSKLLLFFVISY